MVYSFHRLLSLIEENPHQAPKYNSQKERKYSSE